MYLNYAISNMALTTNVGELAVGGEIYPFISFVMFLGGILLIFFGLVQLSTLKKEWHVFYAPENKYAEENSAKKKRKFIHARLLYILGGIIFIASFFVK